MLTKTRIIPESTPVIELRIDQNTNLQKFELILVLGKNEIILTRSIFLPEVEEKMRGVQRRSKVMWNEVLVTGETQ